MKTAELGQSFRALLSDRATQDCTDGELLDAFINQNDQVAFTRLVRRHGSLVLATARRVLGTSSDVDDVFQATFLVLAQRACTIRNRQTLGAWLHGVASRMSQTARRSASRRRKHEQQAIRNSVTGSNTLNDLTWTEVQAMFEKELGRLPDKFRVPFVMCVLEGEARSVVARKLGIKEGTISSRLAEAKRRLQLGLHGVSLSTVLGTMTLGGSVVSSSLLTATVQAAFSPTMVSATIHSLIRGGSMMTKSKLLMALIVLALSCGSIVTGVRINANASPLDVAQTTRDTDKPTTPAKQTSQDAYRVQLLDETGKPLASAAVHLWSKRTEKTSKIGETDADGRFAFQPTSLQIESDPILIFHAPESPVVWESLVKLGKSEVTLRVPKSGTAIEPTIVNLENQPLKGVKIEVVRVAQPREGTLDGWIEKNVRMRKEDYWLNEIGLHSIPGAEALQETKLITDANGKVRIENIGDNRVVALRVSGPQLESKYFWAVTKSGPAEGFINPSDANYGLYASQFRTILAPSRPLTGTVYDRTTGKPVAGAKVLETRSSIISAVTDQKGKYRLEGVPKRSGYTLNVSGAKNVPIFDGSLVEVVDKSGLDAIDTNLYVEYGIEISGKVVDKSTGKPVVAEVMYFPFTSNTNAKEASAVFMASDGWKTKSDGSFYLTVWPGKGVLAISATQDDRFARVDVESHFKGKVLARPIAPVHQLVDIDVAPQPGVISVELVAGNSRKGEVVDTEGQKLSGVRTAGVLDESEPNKLSNSEFLLKGMSPKKERLMLFMHDERKLGALAMVKGDVTDSLKIKLQALSSVSGRVVREAGKLREDLTVTLYARAEASRFENLPMETVQIQQIYGMSRQPWVKFTKRIAKTDAEGRFTIDGLFPGLEYDLYVSDGKLEEAATLIAQERVTKLESGKTKSLGDLHKERK